MVAIWLLKRLVQLVVVEDVDGVATSEDVEVGVDEGGGILEIVVGEVEEEEEVEEALERQGKKST